jgi:hypothetical protein
MIGKKNSYRVLKKLSSLLLKDRHYHLLLRHLLV